MLTEAFMHVFFKPVLLLCILILLFSWVFVRSNTLETTTEKIITSTGMPQQRTRYVFHWDRFSAYITNTPDRIGKLFK
ncbi:MAG: hypothetical protein CVV41_18300 [Candidatus Riflebacteria bacterium HGW-Riflebacteria-1]|nr:MAG: hypothetical protein CVV41_18300 [Candidatus Riflebacteria bacterium HGW-Riflebacteria-1]